jgi:hypothetical protein
MSRNSRTDCGRGLSPGPADRRLAMSFCVRCLSPYPVDCRLVMFFCGRGLSPDRPGCLERLRPLLQGKHRIGKSRP